MFQTKGQNAVAPLVVQSKSSDTYLCMREATAIMEVVPTLCLKEGELAIGGIGDVCILPEGRRFFQPF